MATTSIRDMTPEEFRAQYPPMMGGADTATFSGA